MPIKNCLVVLDGAASSAVALETAIGIQKDYNAHITGYIAVAEQLRTIGVEYRWLPDSISRSLMSEMARVGQGLADTFRRKTAQLEQDYVHVIEQLNASDTSVAEASRFFDVTIVGVPQVRGELHPDRIALLSGRPVLAVPGKTRPGGTAKRAIVGWDGSRAAARSLSSALRLLETKELVTVVTVGEPPASAALAPGLDPKTAIQRQGIAAEWVHVPKQPEGIAATLLDMAGQKQAELLVMGAYEHSKFREDIFGGVTHDVMTRAEIPVFLAH